MLYEFLVFVSLNVNASLVYDHQTLLGLQFSIYDLGQFDHSGLKTLLPFLSRIPAKLWCMPAPPLWHNCPCHQSKRSQLVKLKVSGVIQTVR